MATSRAGAKTTTGPVRRDPPRVRRGDSPVYDQTALRNKDPERFYHLAPPVHPMHGVKQLLSRGWRLERAAPEGVMPAIGQTVENGEPITIHDLMLMSIDLDEHKRIMAEGPWGGTGTQILDERKKAVEDPRAWRGDARAAGLSPRDVTIENQSAYE